MLKSLHSSQTRRTIHPQQCLDVYASLAPESQVCVALKFYLRTRSMSPSSKHEIELVAGFDRTVSRELQVALISSDRSKQPDGGNRGRYVSLVFPSSAPKVVNPPVDLDLGVRTGYISTRWTPLQNGSKDNPSQV